MSNLRSKAKQETLQADLPDIPDKLYFTIGEVSKLCRLKPHVLRYWEQEFPPLAPTKRRGNRRYYQRKDIILIRKIKNLLYQHGFTIEGARQKLLGDRTKQDDKQIAINNKVKQIVTNLEEIANVLETA